MSFLEVTRFKVEESSRELRGEAIEEKSKLWVWVPMLRLGTSSEFCNEFWDSWAADVYEVGGSKEVYALLSFGADEIGEEEFHSEDESDIDTSE